ncbi:MAG: (Fe-S)-binding protein, partial [Deltaproteobacteria bacterium]|nr:(Fe-S)-binding protein [Deltaproteobacteria bacterium]
LCASCYTNCPNDVNVPELVLAARSESVSKDGQPLLASFIYNKILTSNKLLSFLAKTADRFKGIVLKKSPFENGLLSRFSLPVVGERLVPPLAKTFFMEKKEVKALSGVEKKNGKPRVGFFSGCGVNFLMPNVGDATIDVLKRVGAEPIVPASQGCCGMPALSGGERDTAKRLALKNLEAFEAQELDYITTSCATCSHALKSVFRDLLSSDGPELKERVESFSAKVRDITELLRNELSYDLKGKDTGETVTWHDPCHLSRYQGIREEPRELIDISGHELKGMKNPCKCCGLGGGLTFTNYELSREISRKKAESMISSGADVVVTACPGCIVQLRDSLYQFGEEGKEPPKVAHIVELL